MDYKKQTCRFNLFPHFIYSKHIKHVTKQRGPIKNNEPGPTTMNKKNFELLYKSSNQKVKN